MFQESMQGLNNLLIQNEAQDVADRALMDA
jgi:hypothetical protein